jgi:hypothetical protein
MATVSERATGVTGEAPSPIAARVAARVKDRLLQRNQIIEEFFAREAFRLA